MKKRSRHNLNHYRLFTADMGEIIPFGVVEVLPGDTFRHASSALVRFSPLVAPVMHPVHIKMHHWFVPNRLVMSDWEGFITGSDGAAVIPTVTQDGSSDLLDHMGVDPAATGTAVNALPVRAYNLIFNEFYRDQDLDTAVSQDQLTILKARWEKDYFTTARPAPQSGSAVSIPFEAGTTADVISDAASGGEFSVSDGAATPNRYRMDVNQTFAERELTANGTAGNKLYVDLSDASGGIDVNEFRTAIALQRFAEARSRYGSRYVDYLRHLGVRPSDGRLDRPEYLGGGKQVVSFSEVLATAEGTSTNVGDLSGHGIAAVRSRPYRRFFEEHGFVISLMIVRPRAIYGQSLNRHWLRADKEDYWQKELEIVGQQAVTNQELYPQHSSPDGTFGWVDRYLEYRGQPSFVSGDFRGATYDDWHLARLFGSDPALNSTFVECDPSTRVFQAPSEPQMQVMAQHYIAARRMVAKVARA